jgi:hypothetical protein
MMMEPYVDVSALPLLRWKNTKEYSRPLEVLRLHSR